jgi:hypothetical protein
MILFLFSFSSCNEWLDVQPEASVSDDDLFNTEEGFYEALNGVYTRCAQADLYGGEFLVGLPEVMAQNYTNSVYDYTDYMKTSIFDYTDPTFKSKRDGIWKAAYHAIVNCNLILENVDDKKDMLDDGMYELIRGEALALRAYLHFDLLRFFAWSYQEGASRDAIPYVDSYSNKVTPISTVEEVINRVLTDLNEAKTLMAETDPILNAGYVVGYTSSEDATEEDNANLFLQNRRHRMNYYAVCGELARVYLYKGDHSQALANALEVIGSEKFPWTVPSDFLESDVTLKDRIMYNELVFGWYAEAQTTALYNRFSSAVTGLYISYDAGRSLYEVGGVGAEDYRFKAWFTQVSGSDGTSFQIQKYMRDEDENRHDLMAPGIRLSEMYYIAAESIYGTNPSKAWEYFNTVRFNRGIGTSLDESSGATFITEILKEYRKEMYAEGQMFFAYKRLNRNIISQSNVVYPAGPAIYVIPLPEDEIEFGNR